MMNIQSCAKYFEQKKSSKVTDSQQILIFVFAYFLSGSGKNLFLQGRLGKLCPHAVLRF